MFADGMYSLHFIPSKADPDVWIRPATESNGEQYYKYLLVNVDDMLSISEKPEITMQGLHMCCLRLQSGLALCLPTYGWTG